MSPPDTTTILLLWGGWIPACLGKVASKEPFKHATCTKTFFSVRWNVQSVLTWTRAREAEFSLPVQCFWAYDLGGRTSPGSPPQKGQTSPVTLHPPQARALVQDKHLGNQSQQTLLQHWFRWTLMHMSRAVPLIIRGKMHMLHWCWSHGLLSWGWCIQMDASAGGGVSVLVLSQWLSCLLLHLLLPNSSEDSSEALVIVSHLLCSFEYPSRCFEFNLISCSSQSYMHGI